MLESRILFAILCSIRPLSAPTDRPRGFRIPLSAPFSKRPLETSECNVLSLYHGRKGHSTLFNSQESKTRRFHTFHSDFSSLIIEILFFDPMKQNEIGMESYNWPALSIVLFVVPLKDGFDQICMTTKYPLSGNSRGAFRFSLIIHPLLARQGGRLANRPIT